MTDLQLFAMVAIAAVATMLTRFLPFVIFKPGKKTPEYLTYVGRALPPAVFGMLAVYCLKGISFTAEAGFGLPEIIASAVVIILHLAFRKMLLSISAGLAVYLVAVNLIL